MSRRFPPRVHAACTTVGTGALVIGAAFSGKQTIPAAYDGTEIEYTVVDGTAWEEGYGVYNHGAGTLTRTLIASSTGSLLALTGNAAMFSTISSATMDGLLDQTMHSVAYDLGLFFVQGTTVDVTWTVQAGDFVLYDYRLIAPGVMYVAIDLINTSLADSSGGAGVATDVQVRVPPGYRGLSNASAVGIYYRKGPGGTFPEYETIEVGAGSDWIVFSRINPTSRTFVNANNAHRFRFSGNLLVEPA